MFKPTDCSLSPNASIHISVFAYREEHFQDKSCPMGIVAEHGIPGYISSIKEKSPGEYERACEQF